MDNDEMTEESTITIDPDGDVYMVMAEGRLLVSQKVLCLSSRVFQAMLGRSHYRNSSEPAVAADGIQTLSFTEHDFEAMRVIANIMHLQHDKVPLEVFFNQLLHIAKIRDKYDLGQCLGFWPKKWLKPYESDLDSMTEQGGWSNCLFISYTFESLQMFAYVATCLILTSKLSKSGDLIDAEGAEVGEGIRDTIMDQIKSRRASLVLSILSLCYGRIRKLRGSSNKRFHCRVGRSQHICDLMNLGCLTKTFPNLRKPLEDMQVARNSVSDLIEAIREMPGHGLGLKDQTDVIGPSGRRRKRNVDHHGCDSGPYLAQEAKRLMNALDPSIFPDK